MADLIDRDAVEDIITNALNGYLTDDVRNTLEGIGIAISDMPSAQPERLTDDDFETIRIHLSAYKEQLCNQSRWEAAEEYQRIIDRFMSFASAQPEIIRCKDCKWYKTAYSWNGKEHKVCGIEPYGPIRKDDDFCSRGERKDG